LLEYGDGWSRAVRGPQLNHRQISALNQLLDPDRGPSPYRNGTWRDLADELSRADDAACEMLLALLEALARGRRHAVLGEDARGRPLLVSRANAVRAVNTIWASARLRPQEAVPWIGRIFIRTLKERRPMSASVRLRNAAANALVLDGTDLAIQALAAAVPRAPSSALRELSAWDLSLASTDEQIPPSRLAELQVAQHGLDANGERQLVAHRHRYTLQVRPNGRVTLTRARRNANPDVVAKRIARTEARAVATTYRKEVARIEGLLAAEREWPLEEWRRLYLENPITRAVAARTVWLFELPGERWLSVLPDWSRQISALNGKPGPTDWPPGNVTVRLWHPREAGPEELAAWRGLLTNRPLIQPFQQIERDFTRIEPEPNAVELNQCLGVRLERSVLKSMTRRLGWSFLRPTSDERSDVARYVCREFPDAGVSIALTCIERDRQVELDSAWFHRMGNKGRIPLPLDSICPRVYSEAVRDLAVLASGLEEELQDPEAINDLIEEEISDAVPTPMTPDP